MENNTCNPLIDSSFPPKNLEDKILELTTAVSYFFNDKYPCPENEVLIIAGTVNFLLNFLKAHDRLELMEDLRKSIEEVFGRDLKRKV